MHDYGINPKVIDPWADSTEVYKEYGINLSQLDDIQEIDCLIITVAHDCFKKIKEQELLSLFKNSYLHKKIVIDVKGIYTDYMKNNSEYLYWSL